jgi:citrate lyase subunit beta/citryl-CoA lyase
MLFVPATNDRFIQSALRQPADAIQLDLEDSVALDQKEQARERIDEVSQLCAGQGKDVIVRVNRPWRLLLRDIEASVGPHVKALTLPKVPNAAFVQSVAEIIDEVELEKGVTPGSTRLIVMVEDAEGLHEMSAIAAAHPRICGLIVGAEDLAVSMQMAVCADSLYVPNVICRQGCVQGNRGARRPAGLRGRILHPSHPGCHCQCRLFAFSRGSQPRPRADCSLPRRGSQRPLCVYV